MDNTTAKCNASVRFAPGAIGSVEAFYTCERGEHAEGEHRRGLLTWRDGQRGTTPHRADPSGMDNATARYVLQLRTMRAYFVRSLPVDTAIVARIQAEIDAVSGTKRGLRHWIQDYPSPVLPTNTEAIDPFLLRMGIVRGRK